MNLQAFQELVSNTFALNEEQKKYYLSKSENYSEETIQKMAKIIKSQEEEIKKVAEEEMSQKKQQDLQKSHARMHELEKQEERDRISEESEAEQLINNLT